MKLGRKQTGMHRRQRFLLQLYWQLYLSRELHPQARFEINCQMVLIQWELREIEKGQL